MIRTILAFFGYVKIPKAAVQLAIIHEDLVTRHIEVLELSKVSPLRSTDLSRLIIAMKDQQRACHAMTSFLQSGRMLG